jgi:hypothetical protein
MKLLSGSGESEPAWISVGQHAWGFFALGQSARGVIAIGQVAFGLVAIGQVAASGTWSIAMVGIAGRGMGGVIRILPKLTRHKEPEKHPQVCAHADLLSGHLEEGYIEVEIALNALGAPELVVPLALRELVDASYAEPQVNIAWNEGCTVGVVGLVPEHKREGGAFRKAPTKTLQKLVVADTQFWRKPGFHFEAMDGPAKASTLQVLMRLALWVVLVLALFAGVVNIVTTTDPFDSKHPNTDNDE